MPTRTEDVPTHLVTDFDITDPALASPHGALAVLQEKTPVAWSPLYGGHWIVTRYADVHAVIRDWETYSNTLNQVPVVSPAPSIPLQVDPPEHKLYRQILKPLFNPSRMRALEEAIRETTTSLIDGFAARGECDVVQELAHPLTMATFVSLMGWPLEDGERFTAWTEAILVGKPGAPPEEDMAFRAEANEEVATYFAGVIADRRANGGEDPTAQIVNADFQGRSLTDDELQRMLWLLMLGGLHTVRGVLGLGLIHLDRAPTERQRLIDDPSLLGGAVEELLRIEAPVANGRVVTRDTELQGVTLREGDMVLVMLSSANRDPREFPAPDELRVDRTPNRHLSFSGGPHRCVGSHLARIELSVALAEILRRIPDYAVAGEPELHHSQVRGIDSLPIRFTPAQG
jgi:cytochrome P450